MKGRLFRIFKVMSEIRDVRGEVYGRLTIIENLPSKKFGNKHMKRVRAKCTCGVEKEFTYRDLKRGDTKSCGCLNASNKTKVVEGDKYNHWTIMKETEGYFDKKGVKSNRAFLCKCICGKEKNVHLQSLKKGDSKSCGCRGIVRKEKIKKEKLIPENTLEEQWKESVSYPGYYISTLGRLFNFKSQYMFAKKKGYSVTINWKEYKFQARNELYKTFIGEYDSATHTVFGENLENIELKETRTDRVKKLRAVYASMKTRCTNKNCSDYKHYGERGIIIDDSFGTFEKFFNWSINNGFVMGQELSIDRINNDGNYSENNCQWITKKENNRKTRRNVMTIEFIKEVRYGKYKDFTSREIADTTGFRIETIRDVKNFKTWKGI